MKISPTQISLFQECPRKWGFSYLLGYKPKFDSLFLGNEIHHIIDQKWKKNKKFNFKKRLKLGKIIYYPGRIASQIITKKIPFPDFSELKFTFKKHGLTYRGIIDWGKNQRIIDFKTSKNPQKWAKKTKDLLTDPQAILYSLYLIESKSLKACTFELCYLCTNWIKLYRNDPKIKWSKKEIQKRFEKYVEPTAIEINKLDRKYEKIVYIEEIKTRTAACINYGGCPFIAQCAEGQNEMARKKKSKGETALEKIKRQKRALANPPPPDEEETTEEETEEEEEEETTEEETEEEEEEEEEEKPKKRRGRGRPKKTTPPPDDDDDDDDDDEEEDDEEEEEEKPKKRRGRGRPRAATSEDEKPKKQRRKRKNKSASSTLDSIWNSCTKALATLPATHSRINAALEMLEELE